MQRSCRLIPAFVLVLLMLGISSCRPAQEPGPVGTAPPSPPGCRAAFLPVVALAVVAACKRPRPARGKADHADREAAGGHPVNAKAPQVPFPSDPDRNEKFFHTEGG